MKALYDSATGRLVSLASAVPDPLPAGLAVREIGVTDVGLVWDEATRSMVARPAKNLAGQDRFAQVQADADYTALSAANRTRLMALLNRYFANYRYG